MNKKQTVWVCTLLFALSQAGCGKHHYEREQVLSQITEANAHPLNETLILLKSYLQDQPNDHEIRQAMADLLFDHEQYTLAVNQYDKLLKENYNVELVLLRVLQCLAELGMYQSLISLTQQHDFSTFSPNHHAEIQTVLAVAYLRTDRLKDAQTAFDFAKQSTHIAGLSLIEAELALKKGEFTKAARLLKEKVDPEKEDAKVLSAALDFVQGEYETASAKYRGILSRVKPASRVYQENIIPYFFSLLQSNQVTVLTQYLDETQHKIPEGIWQFGHGLALVVTNHWKEAQNAFLLAQQEISLAQIDYFMALIHWRQNNNQQALLAIQRYLDQGKNIDVAQQLQAVIYLSMGDFDKSETVIQQLLKKSPEEPVVLGLLAQVYYQSGHLDRWYQLMKQYPALSQQRVFTYLATAIQLENNTQFQQQLKQLEAHALLDQQAANHYEILQLLAQGEFNLAKEKLDSLAKAAPNDAMTHQLQGLWALTHQDLALAETAYEKAVTLAPDNLGAAQQLAVVALKQQRTEFAKQLLQKALKRHPDQLALTLTLAHAYVVENNVDRAIQITEKDLESYPEHQGSRLFLASIYRQQQHYDRAEAILKAGLDSYPDDAALLSQWIVTKLLKQDFVEAKQGLDHPGLGVLKSPLQMLSFVLEGKIQAASEALMQQPTQSEKNLSQVLAWLIEGQQLQRALPWVDDILQHTSATDTKWLACAEVYLKLDKTKKALAVYEKILQASPDNAIARNNYDWLKGQLSASVTVL